MPVLEKKEGGNMSCTIFADNKNVWNKGLKRPFITLYFHEMRYGIYNEPDSNVGCLRIGEVENSEKSCRKRLPTPGTPLCCYLRRKIKKSMFLRLVRKQSFVCCIKCSFWVQITLHERCKSTTPAPGIKAKPKSKEYTCNVCGKQFARKVSMNSHFPCRNTYSSA